MVFYRDTSNRSVKQIIQKHNWPTIFWILILCKRFRKRHATINWNYWQPGYLKQFQGFGIALKLVQLHRGLDLSVPEAAVARNFRSFALPLNCLLCERKFTRVSLRVLSVSSNLCYVRFLARKLCLLWKLRVPAAIALWVRDLLLIVTPETNILISTSGGYVNNAS